MKKSPGIAVLISLIIPGGGSMYCEKVGKGIGLLIGTIIGYCLYVIPGIIMHIISMAVAYNDANIANNATDTNLLQTANESEKPKNKSGVAFCPHCYKTVDVLKTGACPVCGKEIYELPKVKSSDERKCPYCAEMIKREAILCRYCGKESPANPWRKCAKCGTDEREFRQYERFGMICPKCGGSELE